VLLCATRCAALTVAIGPPDRRVPFILAALGLRCGCCRLGRDILVAMAIVSIALNPASALPAGSASAPRRTNPWIGTERPSAPPVRRLSPRRGGGDRAGRLGTLPGEPLDRGGGAVCVIDDH
jgi:hypothetical protein